LECACDISTPNSHQGDIYVHYIEFLAAHDAQAPGLIIENKHKLDVIDAEKVFDMIIYEPMKAIIIAKAV
jgi:hypothetical protein